MEEEITISQNEDRALDFCFGRRLFALDESGKFSHP
jgi:hypothetical protein